MVTVFGGAALQAIAVGGSFEDPADVDGVGCVDEGVALLLGVGDLVEAAERTQVVLVIAEDDVTTIEGVGRG